MAGDLLGACVAIKHGGMDRVLLKEPKGRLSLKQFLLHLGLITEEPGLWQSCETLF